MRKIQRLKHLLWHVCHYHVPTCTNVTESVVASSREEALKRIFGYMPPPYMPMCVWSEPIGRTA